MPTYYETLGVKPDATPEDIKKSFRKLASECHPDKNPGDKAKETRFKAINEAYQTVGDAEKRQAYDMALRLGRIDTSGKPVQGVSIEDLFSNLQNGMWADFARRTSGGTHHVVDPNAIGRGDDVTMLLQLTLAEAVFGTKKKVRVSGPRPNVPCHACSGLGSEPGTRRVPCNSCAGSGRTVHIGTLGTRATTCPSCRGRGSMALTPCKACIGQGKIVHVAEILVTIPAGVDNGQQLRLAGQGTPGQPPGDLYLNITIIKHPSYTRSGKDLYTEVKIPLVTALRGGHAKFLGLDDTDQMIEIPAGTQSGTMLAMHGNGVRSPLSGTAGKLFVQVHIMLPQSVSPRAQRLLDELADELSRQSQ